jgi:hypothetical protein
MLPGDISVNKEGTPTFQAIRNFPWAVIPSLRPGWSALTARRQNAMLVCNNVRANHMSV